MNQGRGTRETKTAIIFGTYSPFEFSCTKIWIVEERRSCENVRSTSSSALVLMPRPKEFDPEEVLDRATRQFLSTGYEGTSVQDLVEATGLSRSSLYESFGCKHDLYLAALDRYREREVTRIADQLAGDGSPLTRLRMVLEQTAAACEEGEGCFLVDATVERARQSEDTERCAAAGLRGMEEAFADAVRRAQQAGEVPESVAPTSAGRFLANAYRGLHVTAKLQPDRSALFDVINTTLAALQAGPDPAA